METSVGVVNNLKKKRYLVACYKTEDAINSMQQVYLKLKIDYGDRPLTFNKARLLIISEHMEILFRTQRQLKLMDGDQFYGVAKNYKFNSWANSSANNFYRGHLETTKALHGVNDRDGLLSMYLERGK